MANREYRYIAYCNILKYVLVISRYKDDVVVITRDQGRAEVECNNNDIIQVYGIYLAYVPYTVKIGNCIITSCLLNKHIAIGDNYYCSVN